MEDGDNILPSFCEVLVCIPAKAYYTLDWLVKGYDNCCIIRCGTLAAVASRRSTHRLPLRLLVVNL